MDEHIGDLYEAWCKEGLDDASEAERQAFDVWFSAHPAIGNLCGAPDCDFSFTPNECREMRAALAAGLPAGFVFWRVDCGAPGRASRAGGDGCSGYVAAETDLHVRFMAMLEECARRRVKMYGRMRAPGFPAV